MDMGGGGREKDKDPGLSLTPLVRLSVCVCACACAYAYTDISVCVCGFLKNFNLCEWFTSFFGETPSAAQKRKNQAGPCLLIFFWRGGG